MEEEQRQEERSAWYNRGYEDALSEALRIIRSTGHNGIADIVEHLMK